MAMSQRRFLTNSDLEQVLSLMYRDTLELLITLSDPQAKVSPLANPHYQRTAQGFVFSLTEIYQQITSSSAPSFNQYRRMVFASQLNQDLLPHQLKVISHQIETSTNTPLYCLIKLVK
ncbi:MAG: hypothetical protein HRU23_10290 [Gammaproteobacteria bacterium]|nr:hypothetical protein [Gammaproteobacteria bacterium]